MNNKYFYMDYYKLKICEEYWTLQKTSVNCKNSNKYEGKNIAVISPRGRASIWLSDRGVLKVYTDKTITDYYSNKEMNDLHDSYISYQKDGDRTYYCSTKLKNLISLIPNLTEECLELAKIIEKTKIQNSHKHQFSSNLKDAETDEFFGIFNGDE